MSAVNFIANRARYYARTGITFCGTCGTEPEHQPVFSPTMSCGHPWSALMWRKKPTQPSSEGEPK